MSYSPTRLLARGKRAFSRRLRPIVERRAPDSSLFQTLQQGYVRSDHAREIAAVAAGQRRYADDQQSAVTTSFLLRRNIHRLEKGLIMRPRRASFAADYVEPTVKAFLKAEATPGYDVIELKWAEDVFRAYFAAVDDSNPTVARSRALFANGRAQAANEPTEIPYLRDLNNRPVTPEAFHALCQQRRSVRWYDGRPVSRDIIDDAMMAAVKSPTACNRLPFVFRIFDQPERAAQIAGIPMGTAGFSQQVPSVAVLVGRLRAYPNTRDRHAIYIDASLAAMSFMFALETHGVSSCPINWPDQEPHETRIRKALSLDDDERVIMLISFGWPDPEGLVPNSSKKTLDEFRIYDGD